MSTAATATAATEAAPPAKGSKKKLIIIIAVVALVLVGGGVAAMLLMKKKAPDAEAGAEAEEGAPAAHAVAAKRDPKHVPTFVPLEAFTVNLADRDAERYAQLGITLELEDAKLGDQIKAYMPAIRNQILMAIADRTANELLGREGKQQLAEKIRRETAKVLGFAVDDDDEPGTAEAAAPAKKKKKKKAAAPLPITAVHFSNFIIQ
ncbi:MAG: flagellar basal body-associated FliL family protein [Rubrivivax sp.]|nr:flagellar basal body-associated FliL family protein [Rubrivivax sp.]